MLLQSPKESQFGGDAYWQSLANEMILAVRASVRSCAACHTVYNWRWQAAEQQPATSVR